MSSEADHSELLRAVALYYDGENSPVLTAKGVGDVARQIIDLAEEHNVPCAIINLWSTFSSP